MDRSDVSLRCAALFLAFDATLCDCLGIRQFRHLKHRVFGVLHNVFIVFLLGYWLLLPAIPLKRSRQIY
jgi:uncharacterized membrane protein YccF (DUF307 family)